MDGCSYFGLQIPFRNILFILYAVQLTQDLIVSDFLPCLEIQNTYTSNGRVIHLSLQVLNTAAWHRKG